MQEDRHLGEAAPNPGRQDRIPVGHGQPGNDIGQGRRAEGTIGQLLAYPLHRSDTGMPPGEPAKGLSEIIALQQRKAHGLQGLRSPLEFGIPVKKAPVQNRRIGSWAGSFILSRTMW